jgi:hypothetical protein
MMRTLFRLSKINPKHKIKYFENFYLKYPNFDVDFYKDNNPDLQFSDNINYFDHYDNYGIKEERIIEKLKFNFPENVQSYEHDQNTIIYLIDKSLEQCISGYTIKSEHMIKLLKQKFNVIVIVKPSSFVGHKYTYLNNNGFESIDNNYINNYYYVLLKEICKIKPKYVICCSNFINGHVGYNVCRNFDIKIIYEIRGFWEMTKADICPEFKKTFLYDFCKQSETDICKKVNQVWVINKEVGDNLYARGIRNINYLPFYIYSKDEKIIHTDREIKNIGYCGSFNKYENLEVFIQLGKKIRDMNLNYKINMVGNKNGWFKHMVQKEQLNGIICVNNAIDNIEFFIMSQDIMLVTRNPSELSNTVLMMKILDYIYYERIIISTKIRPIETIMKDQCYYFSNIDDIINLLPIVKFNKYDNLKINRFNHFINDNL